MKPFSEYSAEELAMDHLFIRWVNFPEDIPIRSFWENWLKKFPQMQRTVNEARELVRISSDWNPGQGLSNEEVQSIWDRIRFSIGQVREMESLRSKFRLFGVRLYYHRWKAAAGAVFLMVLFFLLFR